MKDIVHRLEQQDWISNAAHLHNNGYTIIKSLITESECQNLVALYNSPNNYRKTVIMERYRFGLGEYKYFKYPLPSLIYQLREATYPYLVPIANQWMDNLNTGIVYPANHDDFLARCHTAGQHKPTALILKYQKNGFNTLHQDLYGDVYFPMQMVLFLNEPGSDYTGGEFVLTEQIPRAQSKALVLTPNRGDALIFTTSIRPAKGARGYYRVNMKHGVSTIHSGERHTLGIIFHDALQ